MWSSGREWGIVWKYGYGANIYLQLSQENFLVNKGELIKLSNGVTIKRNSDLIIIQQQTETIIIISECFI